MDLGIFCEVVDKRKCYFESDDHLQSDLKKAFDFTKR